MTDNKGYFGEYGGRFVPETLIPVLDELDACYKEVKADTSFWAEFESISRDYSGRPTPLYLAEKLTEHCGGARIFLKREDLAHTGAHKINNALGQGLLAQKMGKKRIIAETGAGQHGVAVAAVCAKLGLECHVYMGEEDIRRQSLNVFGSKTAKTVWKLLSFCLRLTNHVVSGSRPPRPERGVYEPRAYAINSDVMGGKSSG